MRRLLPAGLGAGGVRSLYVLGLLSALKAASLVALADAVASGVVSVIAQTDAWHGSIVLGVAAALLRSGTHWFAQVYAVRASIGVKERTRQLLAERVLRGELPEVGGSGAVAALATRGLDDVDKYFTTVLPAVTGAAIIPLVIGTRILFADWISALVVVLTIPLIPVFMVLIGMHTQQRTDAAASALSRLSDHLVELARGLPVLVGLGRADEQTAALTEISDEYRRRTMITLRTAFLSSLALELISTLSVAVVAVFIGFRLVDGSLPLETGLLVLVLAPECYAPFRDLGASFHASKDGTAALDRAQKAIESPVPAGLGVDFGQVVGVRGLSVRYAARPNDAVHDLRFAVRPGSIVALTGPSGAGKSTVLHALAGQLPGDATVAGTLAGVRSDLIAWVPQHPHTVGDTVRDELLLYGAGDADAVDAVLIRLGLQRVALDDPARLSPGELRRIAVARAILRVEQGATLVLLDEPTAHLDDENAGIVRSQIEGLRGRATVVLASHDESVVELADHLVAVDGGTTHSRAGAADEAAADAAPPATPDRPSIAQMHLAQSRVSTPAQLRLLLHLLRPVAPRLAGAVVLGTLAALFAVSLTAVSGWLIVRASEQPPILYLLVAVVGVRFFGIGRSVLRYAERLVTHDAVFVSVTRLRELLWKGLAARGATSRGLFRGGTALDYLLVLSDSVRDLAPRVILPPVIGVLCSVASVIAVAMLHAPAVPFLAIGIAVSLLIAPTVALAADRSASAAQVASRSIVVRRFTSMVQAAPELRINGADAPFRRQLADLDADAARRARRGAGALGLGGALVILAGCVTSVMMLAVSAPAVAAGALSGEVVAVLVLLPLGLLEPLVAVVDAVQQLPALRASFARVAGVAGVAGASGASDDAGASDADDRARVSRARSITLESLAARWPDAASPAFSGVDADVVPGEWLVVTGPSGSGKSTLLTVLLGYLRPSSGTFRLDYLDSRGLPARELRRHIAWCPQEGHLFDSTLRGNLLLSRPRNDAPTDHEMHAALEEAGLGDMMARLPLGLDTRVGSAGAGLSGGERQRVAIARALLSRAEVILLDEPTAHLDAARATSLMRDLRHALRNRVVVLVTHHLTEIEASDRLISLDSPAPATSERLGDGERRGDLRRERQGQGEDRNLVAITLGSGIRRDAGDDLVGRG